MPLEPIEEFLGIGDFAENVVLTIGTSTATVPGVFDKGYIQSMMSGGVIENANPTLQIRTSDATGMKHSNTTAVIRGTTYGVTEAKDDGTGLTILELSRD